MYEQKVEFLHPAKHWHCHSERFPWAEHKQGVKIDAYAWSEKKGDILDIRN